MREIFGDRYFRVELDLGASRIELLRSSRAFESTSALVASVDGIMHALADNHALEFSLIVDNRQAPAGGTDDYRRALLRFDEFVAARFSAVAVVCQAESEIEEAPRSSRERFHYFLTVEGARRALAQLPAQHYQIA